MNEDSVPPSDLLPQDEADDLNPDAEFERGWYDATLDADHWFGLSKVEADEAALLICQFNPSFETVAAIKADGVSIDGMDGEYVERLARRFVDLTGEVADRSMRGWIALASDHGLLVARVGESFELRAGHRWAIRYAEQLAGGEATEDAGQMTKATRAGAGKPKRERTDPLTSVIRAARESALDPADQQSVWAQLVKMAQLPSRPPPLVGFVDGEGVQYRKDDADGTLGYLKKEALMARLRREQARRESTRDDVE